MKKYLIFGFILVLFLASPLVRGDNFTMSKSSITLIPETGQFGTFDVSLTNPTNETLPVNITALDENATKFLFFEKEIFLESNSTKKVTIGFFSSPFTNPVKYFTGLKFNSTILNITIEVIDRTKPEIGECAVTPRIQNQTLPLNIKCVNIFDNIGISQVALNLLKANMTIVHNLTEESLGIYGASFKLNATGVYDGFVQVFDTSGNMALRNISNITIIQYQPLGLAERIDFQSIRFNDTHIRKIGAISNPTPILINVLEMNYTDPAYPNGTLLPVINARLSIGGDERKLMTNLSHILDNAFGDIYLSVFGSELGRFRIRFEIVSLGDSFISESRGTFTFFTIPPKEEFVFDNRTQECQGIYRETWENSTLECLFSFDVDSCGNLPYEECFSLVPRRILSDYDIVKTQKSDAIESLSKWKAWFWVFFGIAFFSTFGWLVYWRVKAWE